MQERKTMENLHKFYPELVGKYDIPAIEPCGYDGVKNWISFNYAKSYKGEFESTGLHFFLDDYQFFRVWREPDKYINILKKFKYVLSPDFSLYTDYPKIMQMYNHYRKHWLATYWQSLGIKVIPTIAWSDHDSYEWCFDGEPIGGTVAVSSVGCMKNRDAKRLFFDGYNEMLKNLKPKKIIFYGNVPDWIDKDKDNIISIGSYQDKFRV